MKMRYATVIASVLGLGLTIAVVGMVGCDTPSTSEPESYFDNNPYSSLPRETPSGPALSISPGNIVTTNTSDLGQAFLFSALGGTDPIAWELVSRRSGSLEVQANGRDVVYRVAELESNTLIARDAAGAAAVATVRGPDDPGFTIAPATTNANHVGQVLLFAATGGREPIAWELSNEGAGTLQVQVDTRVALYEVDALEPCSIIARDASGSAAVALIGVPDTPSLPSLSIAATSDAELAYDGELILLYAQGGIAPYDWHLVYPGRGEITRYGPGNTYIEYMRVKAPDQVVILTDDSGATAQLTIGQPAEGTDPDTPTAPLFAFANPSTVDVNNDLSLLSVTGGKPPYTWAVVPGMTTGGILWPNVGDHVIYQRNNAGDCAVIVSDDSTPPNTAYVIISQP